MGFVPYFTWGFARMTQNQSDPLNEGKAPHLARKDFLLRFHIGSKITASARAGSPLPELLASKTGAPEIQRPAGNLK
jgi:hypothetical protein